MKKTVVIAAGISTLAIIVGIIVGLKMAASQSRTDESNAARQSAGPAASKPIPTAAKTPRKPPPKTTKLPPQETSRPGRIVEIPDYFPPLVFGDNERTHRIWAEHPSRLLAAMTEPKLCADERMGDVFLGDDKWTDHTIFRVLVWPARGLYGPLCVRVQKTSEGLRTVTLIELKRGIDYNSSFTTAPIERREVRELSQEQWSGLEAALQELSFLNLSTMDTIQGRDGVTCIIEAVVERRYHVVRRWGARLENRAFNRAARDILKLANVDEKRLGVRNYVEIKDDTIVMARRGNDWAMFRLFDQSRTGADLKYSFRGDGIFASASGMEVKDFIDIHKGTFRLKWSAAGAGQGIIDYAGNNTGTTPGLGICVTDLKWDLLKRLSSSEIRVADLGLEYWISPFDRIKRSDEDIDRRAAIQALGPIGPDAVPALIKMLGHRDLQLRHYAAFSLARLGPAVVPALIQALADDSYRVRRYAAEALGTIGPEAKEAVRALGLALQDKKYTVRRKAAKALGKIGPDAKEAARALGLALQDKESTVVRAAVKALGKIGPEAVPVLVNALTAEDLNTLYAVVKALGNFGPAAKEAVPALIEALSDEHASVRENAAAALGKIGAEVKTVVPALIEALSDEHASVRIYTADALGKIGPEANAAVPVLVRMFKAASEGAYVGPVVREGGSSRNRVARALGRIGPDARSAVPVLVRALEDKNIYVRRKVAQALGRIGPVTDEVVPALLRALKDPDDEFIRSNSAEALGKIGAKAAKQSVPALIQALKDRSRVRQKAIEALEKIGPAAKEAVPALQALLAHSNAFEKKAAKEAIVKIDPDAKLEPLPPTPKAEDIF